MNITNILLYSNNMQIYKRTSASYYKYTSSLTLMLMQRNDIYTTLTIIHKVSNFFLLCNLNCITLQFYNKFWFYHPKNEQEKKLIYLCAWGLRNLSLHFFSSLFLLYTRYIVVYNNNVVIVEQRVPLIKLLYLQQFGTYILFFIVMHSLTIVR